MHLLSPIDALALLKVLFLAHTSRHGSFCHVPGGALGGEREELITTLQPDMPASPVTALLNEPGELEEGGEVCSGSWLPCDALCAYWTWACHSCEHARKRFRHLDCVCA
jgi:hypothetical protein